MAFSDSSKGHGPLKPFAIHKCVTYNETSIGDFAASDGKRKGNYLWKPTIVEDLPHEKQSDAEKPLAFFCETKRARAILTESPSTFFPKIYMNSHLNSIGRTILEAYWQ